MELMFWKGNGGNASIHVSEGEKLKQRVRWGVSRRRCSGDEGQVTQMSRKASATGKPLTGGDGGTVRAPLATGFDSQLRWEAMEFLSMWVTGAEDLFNHTLNLVYSQSFQLGAMINDSSSLTLHLRSLARDGFLEADFTVKKSNNFKVLEPVGHIISQKVFFFKPVYTSRHGVVAWLPSRCVFLVL